MIKIGDKVLCRFYNTPEHRFYGRSFIAKVKDIKRISIYIVKRDSFTSDKEYFMIPEDMPGLPFWVDRKEIVRIIKE